MLFFYAVLASLAFQGSQQTVQEELRVSFVMLDVVVTTRKGIPVEDLDASDFVVTENGRKVETSFFEKIVHVGAKENDDPRQIILAFDHEPLRLFKLRNLFKEMDRFLESLEPNQYAVNLFSMEKNKSITYGFEPDPERARTLLNLFAEEVINKYMDRRFPASNGQKSYFDWDGVGDGSNVNLSNRSGPRNRTISERGDDFSELNARFGECAFSPNRKHCIERTLEDFVDQQRWRTERLLNTLEELTGEFEDQAGQKMLLFVSPGFPIETVDSAYQLAGLYLRSDFVFPDDGSEIKTEKGFQRIAHACTKKRVVFHTFDVFNSGAFLKQFDVRNAGPGSTQAARIYKSFVQDMNRGMRSLSSESGGYFSSNSDLKTAVHKTLGRTTVSYVLGYNSPEGGELDEFRKLKVKVNRKKVKVRHRKGYFNR